MFLGINHGFLFTNVLQIPNLFEQPFDLLMRLAFVIFSFFFIIAILHENIQAMKGQSDYTGLFIRVILIVGLFIVYERFFIMVVYGMDLLADSILPHEEFRQTAKAFFDVPFEWKYFWKFDQKFSLGVMNYITYAIASAVLAANFILRFALLSTLYLIGPIVASMAVYKVSSRGLDAWMKSLVAISAWKVFLSILMKVISVMNLTAIYASDETNLLVVFTANIVFIVLFILVPIMTHQFVGSPSISGLGSVVLGTVAALSGRYLIRPLTSTNRAATAAGKQRSFRGAWRSSAGGGSYK